MTHCLHPPCNFWNVLFQVSIRDNAAVIEVMRWETIELEAIAHLANADTYQLDGTCGQSAKSNSKTLKGPVQMPLMYEWTQSGSFLLNQDAVGWNARSLNVPGNLVRPGLLYNFQVKVWPQGSPQLSAIANVSIHATPSPLAIKIKGGNRVVNATEDLYVEASVYDPDDSVEVGTNQPYPFEISWTCNNIVLSDHFDAILYPDVSGPLKRLLRIKSSWLTDGMNYTFTAIVSPSFEYTRPYLLSLLQILTPHIEFVHAHTGKEGLFIPHMN
jgi:hypothetical protein